MIGVAGPSLIRDAVRNYQLYLDHQDLHKAIESASLRTRAQAVEISAEFDIANDDGL